MCDKNKASRNNQANATHASGSRAFAVVHEQMEIREGRRVGRAELYVVTHRNKKGEPVDDYCAAKIDEIQSKLNANPALVGEEPHDGDMYSTVFPNARKRMMHRLGLITGGTGSERLAQVVAALHETREENKEFRLMVDTLVESQKALMAKNERMEEQCNEIKNLFLASQKQQASQQEATTCQEFTASNTKKSYKELQSEVTMFHKVKVEKVQESNAQQDLVHKVQANSRKKTEYNKTNKFRVPWNKNTEGVIIKRGMKVGLTSPNSAQLVALGTVQNVDKEATCLDGQPLSDYVEVLINIVLKDATMLPRAQGRVTNMGSAQAHCIPWPRQHVTEWFIAAV